MKYLLKFLFITLFLLLSLSIYNDNTSASTKTLKYNEGDALALNYHRVRAYDIYDDFLLKFSNSKEMQNYSITDKDFEKQIKWLKQHKAHFLTLNEFIEYKNKGHFPKRSVWINFDDMDSTIYDNAYPILKKYKVPATGFVITGEVGQKNFHNLNIINLKELKEMKKSGLWSFASHTNKLHTLKKNGSTFISTSNGHKRSDLTRSTQYLNKYFQEENNSIAYPYGKIDNQSIKLLKTTKIKYGFTLEDRAVSPSDENYKIPRILISNDAFQTLVKTWKGFK
ncbi:intercellular adhesin biosynthesis polysaccharide N-deacetylase [Staphylococcus gallinarum]|nr:intercellular adhesin biosynthesis polysaccharide N-deacetylase [Staphylococcus gallinarum]MEB7040078.1 intercellular adhesin biosynthesis polysaccharide N-deacetylase [Staphylococcus gallinarum]